MPQHSFDSPLGVLTVTEENGVVVSLDWGWPPDTEETSLLLRAEEQLDAYFQGEREAFDLPLAPPGTTFQRRVWEVLRSIPHGETRSYGDLARSLATSPRAIGTACGRNPIPILIPCHRVVGASGSLGGYSGGEGLDTKKFLLDLERKHP
ncbi:MAG: methylated-DNA--[protein]-cysteine S-methyltransferase [Alphaproteobacteria bacterium]